MKTSTNKHPSTLISHYTEEECTFTPASCIEMLEKYMWRMEDCHLKAVLYKHLRYLEEDKTKTDK